MTQIIMCDKCGMELHEDKSHAIIVRYSPSATIQHICNNCLIELDTWLSIGIVMGV